MSLIDTLCLVAIFVISVVGIIWSAEKWGRDPFDLELPDADPSPLPPPKPLPDVDKRSLKP